jgi:hypothetical protein
MHAFDQLCHARDQFVISGFLRIARPEQSIRNNQRVSPYCLRENRSPRQSSKRRANPNPEKTGCRDLPKGLYQSSVIMTHRDVLRVAFPARSGRRERSAMGRHRLRIASGAYAAPLAPRSPEALPSGLETRSRWVIISELWYYRTSLDCMTADVLPGKLQNLVNGHAIIFLELSPCATMFYWQFAFCNHVLFIRVDTPTVSDNDLVAKGRKAHGSGKPRAI